MTASRLLTPAEIALFPRDFTSRFDIANVRLINRAHNPFAIGKILVRGTRIYWPGAPEDFTLASLERKALLAHELCHVWQYATGHLTAWRYLTRPQNWIYGYDLRQGRFSAYPIERQADLIQDWFTVNNDGEPARFARGTPRPTRAALNAIVPFRAT